jgi:hypothetical protein
MRWAGVLGVFLGGGLLVGLSAAAPPPTETRYVAGLRSAAALVVTSANEIAQLPLGSPSLSDAGQRLAAAAGAACSALRAYQDATTRYGTDEEQALVQKVQLRLRQTRISYGDLTGVTLAAPTAKQLSAAEQLLHLRASAAVQDRVADWVGEERLAGVLTAGDLAQVRARLDGDVTRHIEAAAPSLALNAAGLSLSLSSPLEMQVRSEVDQTALGWLSHSVLRFDANGFALELAGVTVVRLSLAELQPVLRDDTHVVSRTSQTVADFRARSDELETLTGAADSASLTSARRALAEAQRALDAATYLRTDLEKEGRSVLLARLNSAGAGLTARMKEARAAFLLDSSLAHANMRVIADGVCKLQGEIVQIEKLAVATTGTIVGIWTAGGGAMQITATGPATFEGRTVEPYTFCQSGSVPLGQVEWKLTRIAPNSYTGSVRYYRVSDCAYIGDSDDATWQYNPADDSLVACSTSPDPALPGGGCETEHRIKP